MKAPILFIVALLLMTTALAGCHEPEGTGPGVGDNGDDPLQVTMTVLDAPDNVTVGVPFNVTVLVETNRDASSDHAGAHYGNQSSADAAPAEYTQYITQVSPHHFDGVSLPGEYVIMDWVIDEAYAGETIYFRAHIMLGGMHYWSEEHSFTVDA